MRLRLLEGAKSALTSYWFIPLLCSLGALGLAAVAAGLDVLSAQGRAPQLAYFRGASPSGVRAILATIAGASISVAGLVFSITMVVISMASSQLGPRLLPNFFGRSSTQVVLGGFLATFIFTLLALVQVTEGEGGAEHHSYALGMSVLLAVLSFALLVYFLNSVTSFIQVPRVIDEVARDLTRVLERETLARREGDEAAPDATAAAEDADGAELHAEESGYLQAIDSDALLRCARRHDLFIRLLYRPGHYVAAGDGLARVAPASRLSGALADELRQLFVIGAQRTNSQDIEFALDQLVEIALRALSPGINDPTTAINCIDRLGGALATLAQRRLPPDERCDEHGTPRLRVAGYTVEGVLDAAFNPLRQHGCREVAVAIRLMEVIGRIAQRGADARLRRALRGHLDRIYEACRKQIADNGDLRDVEARHREAAEATG